MTDAERLRAQIPASTDPKRLERMARQEETRAGIEAFAALLPPHKASLTITHNPHRDYYQTVEEYLCQREASPDAITGYDEMIRTNELWELQVYPETPVGFYALFGPTLASVIMLAREP